MVKITIEEKEIKQKDDFLDRYKEVNEYVLDEINKSDDRCIGRGSNVIIPRGYHLVGMDDTYDYISNEINTYRLSFLPNTNHYTGFIKEYPLIEQSIIPEKEFLMLLGCTFLEKDEPKDSRRLDQALYLASRGDYSEFTINQEILDKFKEIEPYEHSMLMKGILVRLRGVNKLKKLKGDASTRCEFIKLVKEICEVKRLENKESDEEYKKLIIKE